MHQIRELRLMNWKYASFFPWLFPAFSFVAQSQLNCMLTTLVEHLLLTMKIKHSHMCVMSFCFVNSSSIEVPSFSSRWIPDCSAEVLEKRIRLLKQIVFLQNFERWEDEWYEPFLPVWILQNVGISPAQLYPTSSTFLCGCTAPFIRMKSRRVVVEHVAKKASKHNIIHNKLLGISFTANQLFQVRSIPFSSENDEEILGIFTENPQKS